MISNTFAANTCRLCGNLKPEGLDVCSTAGKKTGLLSKIHLCLSREIVHILDGDALPKFVCLDCEMVISKFLQFCDTVQAVQKKLEDERMIFSKKSADKAAAASFTHGNTLNAIHALQKDVSEAATVSVGTDKKVQCLVCQSFLEAVEHTTMHMVTHGIGTVICQCLVCGQRAELDQFVHSSLVDGESSSVWCKACRFAQVSKDNTNQASQKRTEVHRKYKCDICCKHFTTNGHLTRHKVAHTNAKPFLCEICGAGFSQKSSLKLHVLSHAGLNPHKCKHCGQTFRFKVSLHSHELNVHGDSQETRYRCQRCDKQFATAYKLRRHSRSHTGERPYECPRCGRLFSQTSNLNLHYKKHEKEAQVNLASTFDGSVQNVSNNEMVRTAAESYDDPILTQQTDNQQSSSNFITNTNTVLSEAHDPKFLETILHHSGVQCSNLENQLSTMDTVLLHPTTKDREENSQFIGPLNQSFDSGCSHTLTSTEYHMVIPCLQKPSHQQKTSNQIFSHLNHDTLMYINETTHLQNTATSSEEVTLPTFSSLQTAAASMSILGI